jgi:epoxyqueuosine reductase
VSSSKLSADAIRSIAHEVGFDLVRFGPASPGDHAQRFEQWLDAGRHADMDYLVKNRDRIVDPQLWREGVQSSISVAVDYSGPQGELEGGGRIARYAVGRDYHRWLGKRITKLRNQLEHAGLPHGSMTGGTDAVPVLERALAVRSGIGFLAKSSMVISPTHGPYLQLAELLVPEELPHDAPAAGTCGSCTACLDACPTDAIVAPFQVDSRRCLSYTTIEQRGFVDRDMREAQGEWLFGCDICLEVCPFTSKSKRRDVLGINRPKDLQPHKVVETWTLVDVLEMNEERYNAEFVGTAMRRAKRSGMRRNAATVLGNRRQESALPALVLALADEDPVVRGHSAWAIGRIDARHPSLQNALAKEDDNRVREELQLAIDRA